VAEAGERALGAVAVAGGGAVAQRDRGATGEVVVGVGGQVGRAQFLDRARTVERVVGGGDVEAGLGPGQTGAVARCVVLVGKRLAAGGGAGEPLRSGSADRRGCPLRQRSRLTSDHVARCAAVRD